MRSVAGVLLAVFAAVALPLRGAQATETLITSGFVSKHAKGHYRENNDGIGFERRDGRWSYGAGYYRNSLDGDSFYAGAIYLPESLDFGRVRIGVLGALVTGYRVAPVVPALVPTVEFDVTQRVTVGLVAIPPIPGATPCVIAAQLKVRF